MGIYSRDYIRQSQGPSGYEPAGSPTCKWLIIVTVGIFLLQVLVKTSGVEMVPGFGAVERQQSVVTEWLMLSPTDVVYRAQVWRLLTYAFCHDQNSIMHILFNMLLVWFFGRTLESMYGSREFLLFYLAAAVVSGLCFIVLGMMVGDRAQAVGASGAVLAIMMLYAMHFPRQQIYILGIIPIEVRWLVGLCIIFDLFPVLQSFSGNNVGDGVAHSAHLGGLLFGFLYRRYQFRLDTIFGRWRIPSVARFARSRRNVRLYRPPNRPNIDNLDEQVDALLEKIHQNGEGSLTDREREILKAASQRYKNR